MRHNFMFETKWNYTFIEALGPIINRTGGASIPFDISGATEIIDVLGFLYGIPKQNVYDLSFMELSENNYVVSETATIFLNKLVSRYGDHYALQTDKEYTDSADNEFFAIAKKFIIKVINKLDYTYERYATLIDLYSSQKTHLLDKLERTRSGERNIRQDGATSGTGARQGTSSESGSYLDLHNDTPQTTDVVATMSGNQYVSDLKKGSNSASGTTGENSVESGETHTTGEDTFGETEEWDTKTMMEKLSEIEKNFANVWENWLNNFDELFVEEVNF